MQTDDAATNLAAIAQEDAQEQVFNPWSTKGWMTPGECANAVAKDNRYFKHVKINAKAAAKMLEHASHGVQKGRKRSGMPIEIAGLLVGKLMNETFVVMDTLPLPVEGTEAQVVANDGAAVEHPFRALDYIEPKGYSFIGWYHSHPFDLQRTPHWFMSGIDCQSQTLFQQAYNSSWVAIVIDPIRSMYRKTLECGSFYCYPPNFTPPLSNQSPDGIISTQEVIHERWGNAFKRYYLLETDFFMSSTVKNNLRHVFDDWKQCFAPELRRDETEEVYDVARLQTLSKNMDPNSGSSKSGYRGRTTLPEGLTNARKMNSRVTKYECRCRGYAQMIKSLIFNVNLERNQGQCVLADVKMGEN